MRSESKDFVTWSTPDDDDSPHTDFHGPLMTSRDGIAWERPFRKTPFLPRSKPGLFASRSILSNSTPTALKPLLFAEASYTSNSFSARYLAGSSRLPAARLKVSRGRPMACSSVQ